MLKNYKKWSINLATGTVTHAEGWVFKFQPAKDEPGAFDGVCIAQPEVITEEHISIAARIASAAGDAYSEARAEARRKQ